MTPMRTKEWLHMHVEDIRYDVELAILRNRYIPTTTLHHLQSFQRTASGLILDMSIRKDNYHQSILRETEKILFDAIAIALKVFTHNRHMCATIDIPVKE